MSWIWAIWLAVTLGGFGVFEGLAIAKVRGFIPLTDTLRKWLGIQPHSAWQVPATIVFLGVLAWLAIHVATKRV